MAGIYFHDVDILTSKTSYCYKCPSSLLFCSTLTFYKHNPYTHQTQMEQSLSASSSSSSSSSSWWPSLLLVTCAAIAFGSVKIVRQVFSSNGNDDGDDEDNEGFTINAVATEGFNVNVGFGIHRFGVDLHLGYAHTRLRGNYPDVILGNHLLIVSGADFASSSGRRLALDSATAEADQIAERNV